MVAAKASFRHLYGFLRSALETGERGPAIEACSEAGIEAEGPADAFDPDFGLAEERTRWCPWSR